MTVGPDVLDAAVALAFVSAPEAGGTALFSGTVRSPDDGRRVDHLDYEAWEDRVTEELESIAAEAADVFHATRVWIAHRTGRVGVGESSVIVAASAPHRAEAFDACRWAIDSLKRRASIWKRESSEEGGRWVANA